MEEDFKKFEERFGRFLENEWPHLMARVGRLEGAGWAIAGGIFAGMSAIIALLGVLVAK